MLCCRILWNENYTCHFECFVKNEQNVSRNSLTNLSFSILISSKFTRNDRSYNILQHFQKKSPALYCIMLTYASEVWLFSLWLIGNTYRLQISGRSCVFSFVLPLKFLRITTESAFDVIYFLLRLLANSKINSLWKNN